MTRTALISLALGFATLTACGGSATTDLDSTDQSAQQLKKKSDGSATGDGSTCSLDGVSWSQASSSTTGGSPGEPSAPVAPGAAAPSSAPPSKATKTTYPVGAKFPSPDGCNTCACAPDGIWCTVKACGGTGGGGKSCVVDGNVYADGTSFPSPDGCNTCACNDGAALCSQRACFDGCTYDGNLYPTGASFPSGDGCNTCSCDASGAVLCTARACAE